MLIREALSILRAIEEVQAASSGISVKFSYWLEWTRRKFEGVEKTYLVAVDTPEQRQAIEQFQRANDMMWRDEAVKDSHGMPMIEGNRYVCADEPASQARIEAKLRNDFPGYTSMIEERTKRIAELGETDAGLEIERRWPISQWPELPVPAATIGRLFDLMIDDLGVVDHSEPPPAAVP